MQYYHGHVFIMILQLRMLGEPYREKHKNPNLFPMSELTTFETEFVILFPIGQYLLGEVDWFRTLGTSVGHCRHFRSLYTVIPEENMVNYLIILTLP